MMSKSMAVAKWVVCMSTDSYLGMGMQIVTYYNSKYPLFYPS